MHIPANPKLYCILDLGYVAGPDAAAVTANLLAGGADLLQLRAKNHDLATIRRVAESLLPLCRAAGVPFILNDHPALAAELGADGVHLGQDDGPLAAARLAMGPGKIIGRSTHSLAQARAALAEGFDYIGFGPLFATPTKPGRPAIGLQEIAAMEREVGTPNPRLLHRRNQTLQPNNRARRRCPPRGHRLRVAASPGHRRRHPRGTGGDLTAIRPETCPPQSSGLNRRHGFRPHPGNHVTSSYGTV